MNVVVKAEGLGKRYQIRHDQRSDYPTLRESLAQGVMTLFTRPSKPEQEDFWALRNFDLEIVQGERIGIIGPNGAGKSTLLKLISRITEPSEGRIRLCGQVASLLEVGTGFHPELSGRENIYLNGSILGMSRKQVQSRFDEIIEFAGLERFLDTPVKRYSSGMYTRLAFSVAAHLKSDILIVDEVLAVGDAAFQAKCLGKMQDIADSGRTILFVSHQLGAVQNLCDRCCVLQAGQVAFTGPTKAAIDFYLRGQTDPIQGGRIPEEVSRAGNGAIRLIGFTIEDDAGHPRSTISTGDDVVVKLDYQVADGATANNVSCGISLHTMFNQSLCVFYSGYKGATYDDLSGSGSFRCRIRNFPFVAGRYMVRVRATVDGEEADRPSVPAGFVDVEASDYFGTGRLPDAGIGPVLIDGDWEIAR